MKNTCIKFLLFILCAFSSLKTEAQSICMVSADYQVGDKYMVIWEVISDITNIDSVIIYRKQGAENFFSRVGAVDVTANSSTIFIDQDANTMILTKYAISYLYNNGTESALSLWHQASVLDYEPGSIPGELLWTKYQKENQTDESYIYSYECFWDQTGLGVFGSSATFMNYDTQWIDVNHTANPSSKYVLEVSLPTCNVITKSNINTSRSNIKNQQSNATVLGGGSSGIQSIQGTSYSISPNPVSDIVTITTEKAITGSVWISNLKGQIFNSSIIEGTSVKFDVNSLPSGVYFVNVENEGVVSSKKIVKK